jgi:hypothetical protein
MDVNQLNAKDICAIIKACRSNSVDKFALKDLVIEMGPASSVRIKWPSSSVASVDDLKSEYDYGLEEDEKDLQMALENPVEWERMQLEEKVS